jgi:RND family efflux transporter MFP subunit
MRKLITVVLLFALLALTCSKKTDTETAATWKKGEVDKPAVAVEAVTAEKGSLIPAVEASGVIAGGNEAYAVMEARGIITGLYFRLGDYVKKGDLLVKVDDTLAASSLRLAEQQYSTAKINFNAAEGLYKNGGMSLIEYNQAESRMIQAQVARDQARKASADCSLRAPVSGYVASRDPSVTLGNLVIPGTRAAWIVDTSFYRMELAVGERSIGLIREGLPVIVYLAETGEKITGQAAVQAVAAGSDRSTGSYPVVIEWKKSDIPVKPGMSATAYISLPEENPVIIIPARAVLKRDGKPFVYTARNGEAWPVEIVPGRRLGPSLAVTTGLAEGDVVILSGLASLTPGLKVIPAILGGSGEVR